MIETGAEKPRAGVIRFSAAPSSMPIRHRVPASPTSLLYRIPQQQQGYEQEPLNGMSSRCISCGSAVVDHIELKQVAELATSDDGARNHEGMRKRTLAMEKIMRLHAK